jgi:hypothetical protein
LIAHHREKTKKTKNKYGQKNIKYGSPHLGLMKIPDGSENDDDSNKQLIQKLNGTGYVENVLTVFLKRD